jgi:hypothetical protein
MMAKKHLKREPHKINENAWWYEANGGIEVFYKDVGMIMFIPIASIRAYVRRKDKE